MFIFYKYVLPSQCGQEILQLDIFGFLDFWSGVPMLFSEHIFVLETSELKSCFVACFSLKDAQFAKAVDLHGKKYSYFKQNYLLD